jgi:hypothetical protein
MKKVHQSWECPTGCGSCCFDPQIKACRPTVGGWCKHHTDIGCKLPDKERPWQCNEYLCEEVAANTPGYKEKTNG